MCQHSRPGSCISLYEMAISGYGQYYWKRRRSSRQGRQRFSSPRSGASDTRPAGHSDQARSPHGASSCRCSRIPPVCCPRHAGPVRPWPAVDRTFVRRRRGSPPHRGHPCSCGVARSHGRVRPAVPAPGRSAGLRRRRRAVHGVARLHPGGRHSIHACRFRCPSSARVGGSRSTPPGPARRRVHGDGLVRSSPARLGPVDW